jgi:hypothetical protein
MRAATTAIMEKESHQEKKKMLSTLKNGGIELR